MSFDPKVVPFDRSAAYMHHRAMKNRRDNNVVDALELLRRAVERSPDNDEYKLTDEAFDISAEDRDRINRMYIGAYH